MLRQEAEHPPKVDPLPPSYQLKKSALKVNE
jgi:hypothetical protein